MAKREKTGQETQMPLQLTNGSPFATDIDIRVATSALNPNAVPFEMVRGGAQILHQEFHHLLDQIKMEYSQTRIDIENNREATEVAKKMQAALEESHQSISLRDAAIEELKAEKAELQKKLQHAESNVITQRVQGISNVYENTISLYRGTVVSRIETWNALAESRGLPCAPRLRENLRDWKHMMKKLETEHAQFLHDLESKAARKEEDFKYPSLPNPPESTVDVVMEAMMLLQYQTQANSHSIGPSGTQSNQGPYPNRNPPVPRNDAPYVRTPQRFDCYTAQRLRFSSPVTGNTAVGPVPACINGQWQGCSPGQVQNMTTPAGVQTSASSSPHGTPEEHTPVGNRENGSANTTGIGVVMPGSAKSIRQLASAMGHRLPHVTLQQIEDCILKVCAKQGEKISGLAYLEILNLVKEEVQAAASSQK